MVKNKKLKRMIYGGVGFFMAGVMFFAASMQNMQEVAADVRVFDKISQDFPKNPTAAKPFSLPILEIVPDASLEEVSEMGYFLPSDDYLYKTKTETQTDKRPFSDRKFMNPTITSQGTVHGVRTNDRDETDYPDVLLKMRNYGLIKALGIDTTGEYPFYIMKDGSEGIQAFSNYQTATNQKYYTSSMEKGVYSLEKGDYNITEGYTIDENGTICSVEKVSVSDNAVDENGNSISENDATYDPETKTITVLTPVKVDKTKMALPQSKDGSVQYITQAAAKGEGNVKFTPTEKSTKKTQYYGFSDMVLYYMTASNGYYYNASYFREYVLGSADDYEYLEIDYQVKSASEVTAADIQNAKLIYISGTAEAFAKVPEYGNKHDISTEVLLEIYNQEVLNRKAVMMDYACYSADVDTNVSKLATLLWRDSQSAIRTTYADSYQENTDILASVDFMKGDALKDLQGTMMSGADGNFVTGNVYVYNHVLSNFDDPKSMVDARDNFANGDFNSAYTAGAMQQGFSSVLSYITATNKNSTTGQMSPSVTPAIAIQYILVSDGMGLSIVKTSLNVLEIQPVSSFLYNETRGMEEYGYLSDDSDAKANREYFVKNYLGNYYDDKVEYVNFTSMTIDEFNGRNEDLIETYDIIYIGSEWKNFYYTANVQTRKKLANGQYSPTWDIEWVDLPGYKDTTMNGMVYYNIGDKMTVNSTSIDGWIDTGDKADEYRYAGRDLSRNKLQKLIDYLDAEGLVFVEGDLVAQISGAPRVNPTAHETWTKHTLDNGRIDNSSNMYEFMKYAIGEKFNKKTGNYETGTLEQGYKKYNNLVSICDLEAGLVDKTLIDQYVATEKLELTMTEQPKEYSYSLQENSQVMDPGTVQYMEEDNSGVRKMTFGFIISTDMVGVTETSTYTPHLYVDVNNDGKYSGTSEDIKDVVIVNKGSGEEAERDAENRYILYKDVEYELTRELDDSYSGYIKWKLSIESNIFENSHASVEGSTVVKNNDDDRIVKILQITKDNSGDEGLQTNLNLEEQLKDTKSKFGKYLAAVPGYKVAIKTVSVGQFETDFLKAWGDYQTAGTTGQEGTPAPQKKSLQEYALDYFDNIEIAAATDTSEAIVGANMLVLGFGDDYTNFSSAETIQAVQSYMESEKPVLLAHDFIMFQATANQAKYLRNTVGMDKYGMTQNITTETLDDKKVTKLVNYASHANEGSQYLHSGVSYTRSDDPDEVALIESTGKAVAYQPGSKRETILSNTHGLSNSILHRFKNTGNNWINNTPLAGYNDAGAATYAVNKINDGQITSYPYELPENFTVARTHAQYFQLDFDEDSDGDGESDVVVWYTLGNSDRNDFKPFNDATGGSIPSDGFYIYNKGNITYTGAGHADMANGSSEVEAQLFINTLFAAYNATKTQPTVGFFEEVPDADDRPVDSIAIPYDENVTKGNAFDSSVLKDAEGEYRYYFVNPNVAAATMDMGTPVYFRLSDTNFVRGQKYLEIEYYLKANDEAGKSFELDDGTSKTIETLQVNNAAVPVVNISDKITTYSISNKAFASEITRDTTTGKLSFMESGVVYGFYLPMSYLKNNSQFTIYIKAKTHIYTSSSQTGQTTHTEVPGEGISSFTVTKADLLDLD